MLHFGQIQSPGRCPSLPFPWERKRSRPPRRSSRPRPRSLDWNRSRPPRRSSRPRPRSFRNRPSCRARMLSFTPMVSSTDRFRSRCATCTMGASVVPSTPSTLPTYCPSASTKTLPSAGEGPVNGTSRPPSWLRRSTVPSNTAIPECCSFPRSLSACRWASPTRAPTEGRSDEAEHAQGCARTGDASFFLVGRLNGDGFRVIFRNVHDEGEARCAS